MFLKEGSLSTLKRSQSFAHKNFSTSFSCENEPSLSAFQRPIDHRKMHLTFIIKSIKSAVILSEIDPFH